LSLPQQRYTTFPARHRELPPPPSWLYLPDTSLAPPHRHFYLKRRVACARAYLCRQICALLSDFGPRTTGRWNFLTTQRTSAPRSWLGVWRRYLSTSGSGGEVPPPFWWRTISACPNADEESAQSPRVQYNNMVVCKCVPVVITGARSCMTCYFIEGRQADRFSLPPRAPLPPAPLCMCRDPICAPLGAERSSYLFSVLTQSPPDRLAYEHTHTHTHTNLVLYNNSSLNT
jgi:hypothetical protein